MFHHMRIPPPPPSGSCNPGAWGTGTHGSGDDAGKMIRGKPLDPDIDCTFSFFFSLTITFKKHESQRTQNSEYTRARILPAVVYVPGTYAQVRPKFRLIRKLWSYLAYTHLYEIVPCTFLEHSLLHTEYIVLCMGTPICISVCVHFHRLTMFTTCHHGYNIGHQNTQSTCTPAFRDLHRAELFGLRVCRARLSTRAAWQACGELQRRCPYFAPEMCGIQLLDLRSSDWCEHPGCCGL